MKRFSMAMTWLALAGLMTMVSCRKPVVGFTNGEARTVTVSAATENGDGSKTSIDGLYVKWSEGDKISMNGCELTLEEGAGGTMGRFTGEVTDDGPYYIGYPAGKTKYDNGTLKLTMPATLTYDTEKEIVPMAAYAEKVGDDVQFRNAVNMLKLQLKGDGTDASKLKSIVLTSTTSNLSGDIRVTFEGTTPTFNAITDGEDVGKTMTVSFGDGLQLTEEATCVYIPLAKISVDEVLTVRFNCVKGSMEKKLTATEGFSDVNNMLSAPELMMGHEYVDLGLPSGLKWATCNVGASKPEDYGDYYAWGETETNSDYDWSTYKWCNGSYNTLTKYCTDSDYGTVDNKTVLDLEDDAARANWGGAWRMPTTAEWEELTDNTYMEWVYDYADGGVNGFVVYKAKDEEDMGLMRIDDSGDPGAPEWKIYDKDGDEASLKGDYSLSDAHLFLPVAGYRNGTSLRFAGSDGFYWSSSLHYSPELNYAYGMYFNCLCANPQYINDRCYGFSVRSVR